MGAIASILAKLIELLANIDILVRLWKKIRGRFKRKPKRKPRKTVKKKPKKTKPAEPQNDPAPDPPAPPPPEKPEWLRPKDKPEAIEMYRGVLERHADGLPLPLLLAVCWQESTFNPKAYRYEPNYDYTYVRKVKSVRLDMPPYKDFLCEGITIDQWFTENPKRSAAERKEGRDYSFPAQLRIAASYGLMQLMYPTAVAAGHRAAPEDLFDPEVNVPIGVKVLKGKLAAYGGNEQDAVAAYNAGKARKNPDGTYRNQVHVDRVMRHRAEFEKLLTSPPPADTV